MMVMLLKGMTTLTFAAACLTAVAAVPAAHAQSYATPNQVVTNGPQSSGVDRSASWSAQQNVKESEHYHWLLEHNARFRAQRERIECGPITDPTLHQRCLQSFAEYSPYGTSTPTYANLGTGGNYGSTGGANYGTAAGGTYGRTGWGNYGTTGANNYGTTGPANSTAGGWNAPSSYGR
jgi:hypothetical protein